MKALVISVFSVAKGDSNEIKFGMAVNEKWREMKRHLCRIFSDNNRHYYKHPGKLTVMREALGDKHLINFTCVN